MAGLPDSIPPTLQEAFGLPLVPVAAQQCISCHTTAAVTSGQLHVDTMIGGVTCEACHGPGAQHVSLMERQAKNRRLGRSLIFNPAVLDPVNLENFCGECHRTSRLVMAEDLHGLDTIHYEPYRLEMSQCWIMTRRITCVTCHDPHQPLQHDPGSYDPACLSCHPSSVMDPARRSSAGLQFGISRAPEDAASPKDGATSEATARVPAPVPLEALIPSRDDEGAIDRTYVAPHTRSCPVANANCITCHMPKCSLPLAPFTMSDHFIRIVTRNDACSTE